MRPPQSIRRGSPQLHLPGPCPHCKHFAPAKRERSQTGIPQLVGLRHRATPSLLKSAARQSPPTNRPRSVAASSKQRSAKNAPKGLFKRRLECYHTVVGAALSVRKTLDRGRHPPLQAGVAEWQTRWIQNPVSFGTCGFDPHLRYSFEIKDLRQRGVGPFFVGCLQCTTFAQRTTHPHHFRTACAIGHGMLKQGN